MEREKSYSSDLGRKETPGEAETVTYKQLWDYNIN